MSRTPTRYMVVAHCITGDNAHRFERQMFLNEFSEAGAWEKFKAIIRNQGGYVDDGEKPIIQRAELADEHTDYSQGFRQEHTGEFGRGTVSNAQEGEA